MRTFPILALLALAACDPTEPAAPGLPLLGGFRDAADLCQRVGEDENTNQFLDHTAVLVGCPTGMENMGVFVTETGAVQVGELAGYTLFRVPRN